MTQWGIDALFNPAKRHMDEEKRRLQSTREEVGDSSGGKRIDFESGKVTIKRADEADEPGAADEKRAKDARDGNNGKDGLAARPANRSTAQKSEPSPAAVRAAARRGRQPR